MKYDVLIRIDKLNTDLSEDEIRDILSRYINENIICDRLQIKIFLEI
jgi:hypothetical protein